MIQRDIIQQQIEALGRVLGKIVTAFLGLKSQGKVAEGFQIANQQFKSELDIDIDKLLGFDKAALADFFEAQPITSGHLEQIADYVTELGEHQSDTAAKTNAFNCAYNLVELANAKSDTFDMNRQLKVNQLKEKIDQLK